MAKSKQNKRNKPVKAKFSHGMFLRILEWSRNHLSWITGTILFIIAVITFYYQYPTLRLGRLESEATLNAPITPTVVAKGLQCHPQFSSGIQYFNSPELSAISQSNELALALRSVDFFIAFDVGCQAKVPFNAKVNIRQTNGDPNSYICLAIGKKLSSYNTIEDYYAFCINSEKKWGFWSIQQNATLIAEGRSDFILPSGEDNLIGLQVSNQQLKMTINSQPIYTENNIEVFEDIVGMGAFSPAGGMGIPEWIVGDFNVWSDTMPIGTPYSLAAVKVISIADPTNSIDLSVGVPVQISDPVATFLLVDHSGSIYRNPEAENLIESLVKMFVGISPPNDKIGIASFADDVKVLLPLTLTNAVSPQFTDIRTATNPQASTDFVKAFNIAAQELQQANENKHVVLITDGILGRRPGVDHQYEYELLEGLHALSNEEIKVDVLLVRTESNKEDINSYMDFWNRLNQYNNVSVYEVNEASEIMSVAMDVLYSSHTNRPGQNHFTLKSPGKYTITIPVNAQKMVFSFSIPPTDLNQPLIAEMKLVNPNGYVNSYRSETGLIVLSDTSSLIPGEWTFELSSSLPTNFELSSLLLFSSK